MHLRRKPGTGQGHAQDGGNQDGGWHWIRQGRRGFHDCEQVMGSVTLPRLAQFFLFLPPQAFLVSFSTSFSYLFSPTLEDQTQGLGLAVGKTTD